MPIPQEFKDSYQAVDAATTRLGTSVTNVATNVDQVSIRVWALVQKLADAPTAEEVTNFKNLMDAETNKLDAAVSGLDAVAVVLQGIAKDPDVPVPDPVPDPIPVDPPGEPVEPPGEPVDPMDPTARRRR